MLPTYYIPHGGGPCFFMDWDPADTWNGMRDWLAALPASLPETPKAILMISAHWQENIFTVSSNPRPDLIFDYYGFPKHTYNLTWPASGDAVLAARVRNLCAASGMALGDNPRRGFDHGVFIPLKVAFPQADIPTVALSIRTDYDPAAHIALGQALQSLRLEGVLIIGSGMSFHNLRAYRFHSNEPVTGAEVFDAWLTETVTHENAATRNQLLTAWEDAPQARFAHPDEDHLLPLMVVAGAAGTDKGLRVFHERVMGTPISAYRFG